MPRHACPVCSKVFDKPARLKRHALSHSGERPYPCSWEGCTQAYTRPDHLERHVAADHTKERKWRCPVASCDAAFYESSHLTRHASVHEREPSSPNSVRRPGAGAPSGHLQTLCHGALFVYRRTQKKDRLGLAQT